MTHPHQAFTTFSEIDIHSLEPEMKVGILATINPDGLPHMTLISSLRAHGARQVIWGQFIEGQSKQNVLQNPKTGFLMMTLDRNLWRGKALWTHRETSGPEFDLFNSQPMFRYNAYFGIHTVHYMDLIETYGREALPMPAILAGSILTELARTLSRPAFGEPVLNLWTRQLISGLSNPKFLAWIGPDGFPEVTPVLQARPSGGKRVIFSPAAYRSELDSLAPGSPVALFGLTLQMEDVLLRGVFHGYRRVGGLRCGVIEVDWVYNSMPPIPGQIYPRVELKAVERF